MKTLFFLYAFTICSQVALSQTKLFTKSATISFYSKAPLEDIEAHNTKSVSVYDPATGRIEFSVLLKGFEFEKAKMQEHFNENYVESDKYPKAVFMGVIEGAGSVKATINGVYNVQVSGSLTLHGVTKPHNAESVITVQNGIISAVSVFNILLADYNIKIPALVADKISKTVKIVVNVSSYQPLSNKPNLQ